MLSFINLSKQVLFSNVKFIKFILAFSSICPNPNIMSSIITYFTGYHLIVWHGDIFLVGVGVWEMGFLINSESGGFTDGLVVRTLGSHCSGRAQSLVAEDPASCLVRPKNKVKVSYEVEIGCSFVLFSKTKQLHLKVFKT